MYCWGSCTNGQLGLGGIEEEHVLIPRRLEFDKISDVVEGSCGVNHTVVLLKDGSVYSCGLNDFGQLGHDKGCMRFEKIEAFYNQVIKHISCGFSHSLVLNEWGQIFSWGQNDHGQLGLGKQTDEKTYVSSPKMVKALATLQVIQIACGYEHSLSLTSSGNIYSWGNNSNGQLGLGTPDECQLRPTFIQSLHGLPISQVAAGGYHSFALTKSGAVFGWGKNSGWQLGLEDKSDRLFPTHLKFLRSQKIIRICCGEDHTVALTLEGGLFTWGAGTYGQLGHNVTNNEYLPRKVIELMGTPISQVACGRKHTLAYASSTGRLYGFGLGGSGQLGINARANKSNPVVVQGPWVAFNANVPMEEDQINGETFHIHSIFCGGAQSFSLVKNNQDNEPPLDMRIPSKDSQLQCLTRETVSQLSVYSEDDNIPMDVFSFIETVFSSSSCLNCSYLRDGDSHFSCGTKNHGIDFALAKEEFSKISTDIRNSRIIELIGDCLHNVLKSLPASPPDMEALRIYLLLPTCHFFTMPEKYLLSVIIPYTSAVNKLTNESSKVLGSWFSIFGLSNFFNMMNILKKVVIYILTMPSAEDSETLVRKNWIFQSLHVLGWLHKVSVDNGSFVSYDQFYIPEITEKVNVRMDYVRWRQERCLSSNNVYFCDFPFIFDAPAKSLLLQADASLQMQNAMDGAHLRNAQHFFMPLVDLDSPFLVLHVERVNIVIHTLQQLHQLGDTHLKKPLKVIFHGEEAVDQGGVRKEFFLLLMKEILDPKFGMFTRYQESLNIWFCETTYEEDEMFYLVGIVCGLAIYNFTIIALPFPLALYKKLLNKQTKLDDLNGLSPPLAKNLNAILEYDGSDFEEVFCLTFEITRENFGERTTFELKENGKNISVTQKNKHEYVDLYVDFILNKSVSKQYRAFHGGFHRVCGGRVLELFQPQELMEMVIGNENYDWQELEINTEYKGGYTTNHKIIRYFWKVFHSLSQEEKKKFLLFLTGTDRIPILGMSDMRLVIQPMNVGEDHMPVAHTCFNLLDLPPYRSEAQLRKKLLQAIEHTQGFGLA